MKIALEGLIGIGKSTVLDLLKGHGYTTLVEPMEQWSLLDQFYKEPQKYATVFEAQVLCSYAHVKFQHDVIMERSAESAVEVFSRMQNQCGNISDNDFQLLRNLQSKISSVDAFIYLCMPAKTALERIRIRSRPEEHSITLEYLSALQEAYDAFFSNLNKLNVVIRLNGSERPQEVCALVLESLKDIGLQHIQRNDYGIQWQKARADTY